MGKKQITLLDNSKLFLLFIKVTVAYTFLMGGLQDISLGHIYSAYCAPFIFTFMCSNTNSRSVFCGISSSTTCLWEKNRFCAQKVLETLCTLCHFPTLFSIQILTLNVLKCSVVKKSLKLCLNPYFPNVSNQGIYKYYFQSTAGAHIIKETLTDFLWVY